ncbi:MAG: multiprotein-bridging factor 1 family protein [Halobacteriaceae archaeon]
MAKYSTDDEGETGGGDTCELCGTTTDQLELATVAGAKLEVCSDCAPHSDTAHKDEKESNRTPDQERKRQAAQNTAKARDAVTPDSSYWVEKGTNYESDQLPYLISNYGDRAKEARQAAGLQREELAVELGIKESEILAVEQNRAAQAGIGGSVIEAIEHHLNIELTEQQSEE